MNFEIFSWKIIKFVDFCKNDAQKKGSIYLWLAYKAEEMLGSDAKSFVLTPVALNIAWKHFIWNGAIFSQKVMKILEKWRKVFFFLKREWKFTIFSEITHRKKGAICSLVTFEV